MMHYKNYLLVLLMIVLAFNYVDRVALGLLLEGIKTDLDLSDTQLGFLSGLAFALFYSVMGIPIARLADRGNRVTIIALTTGLWSVAVALCGVAGSFVQLLLIRVGVAIGEAGCFPTAHSLIADQFTRAERPRAVARFMLGVPLALCIGYFAAGWLNEFYGWRTTFIVLGLPGVALAVIAHLTLVEPRRTPQTGGTVSTTYHHTQPDQERPTAKQTLVELWSNTTFRHLMIANSIWHFFGFGLIQWQPTFFIRSHGMQTGELGVWLTVVYGVTGLVGTFLGGECAARYARNDERLQLKAAAVMFSVFAGFSALAYLVSSHQAAFVLIGIGSLGGAMANGPIFATMQTLVPARMRAMSLAIVLLFANFIGNGLGPLGVGVLSDAFSSWADDDSLRYALVVFCPGYFWAAWHFWRASKTVFHDIASVSSKGGIAVDDESTVSVIDRARGTASAQI